jgi:hypothetical protein
MLAYIVRKAKEEEEFMTLKDCFTVNLDDLASWQARAFYRSLGVRHKRSTRTRRIHQIAVRVLRLFGSDLLGLRMSLAKGVEFTIVSMHNC